MADYLVDTSVLLRFASPLDPSHAVVAARIRELLSTGNRLFFTPQSARECWAVLTRSVTQNGAGMSPEQAVQPMEVIASTFEFLDDKPGIYAEWTRLVESYGVSGRQVHDANHVAAMVSHGLTHLLTLDQRDFRRYSGISVSVP